MMGRISWRSVIAPLLLVGAGLAVRNHSLPRQGGGDFIHACGRLVLISFGDDTFS